MYVYIYIKCKIYFANAIKKKLHQNAPCYTWTHFYANGIFEQKATVPLFLPPLSVCRQKEKNANFVLPPSRFLFFSFCCHRRPEFIATFVFSRPPLTSSSHRPALPFDGCCHVKMV